MSHSIAQDGGAPGRAGTTAAPEVELFDKVLGQFFYSRQIIDDCMLVEMQWRDRGAVGILHVPATVSTLIKGTQYENIKSGESLALPIALGLSLILAGLTDADLVLSGDRSVWKETWGALLDAPIARERQLGRR